MAGTDYSTPWGRDAVVASILIRYRYDGLLRWLVLLASSSPLEVTRNTSVTPSVNAVTSKGL